MVSLRLPVAIAVIVGITAVISGVDASRHLTQGWTRVNELNTGYPSGGAGPRVVDSYSGELISSEKGVWNDYTDSWEKVVSLRRQARYELVQQRNRHADFKREYESYQRSVSDQHNAIGDGVGLDDTEVDSDNHVRGEFGDEPR